MSGERPGDGLAEAARRRAERERKGREEGDVPLSRRLAQIGVLGWIVVTPMLGGAALGRWLDRLSHSGIFFTAPLLLIGLALGCYLGWRWIQSA